MVKNSIFVRRVSINCTGGSGGDGCYGNIRVGSKINRQKAGGNGGNGGSVYVVAKRVSKLPTMTQYHAGRGQHGQGHHLNGRHGTDCSIFVPLSTEIIFSKTRSTLGIVLHVDDRVLVSNGGRGGRGNKSTRGLAHPGQKGEAILIELLYKPVVDLVLIGPEWKFTRFHSFATMTSRVKTLVISDREVPEWMDIISATQDIIRSPGSAVGIGKSMNYDQLMLWINSRDLYSYS